MRIGKKHIEALRTLKNSDIVVKVLAKYHNVDLETKQINKNSTGANNKKANI